MIYTRDFEKIPDIARNILDTKEVERIMDKIKKLNDDSLLMSELKAIKWQEREDKSLLTEARKNGITEGIELTIKNMYKNNIPIETISKGINKTIKEIEKIIKEN